MNSRFKILTRTGLVIALLGLLASCQDTIPKRSLISSKSIGDLECPEGQELIKETVDDEEVQVCKDKVIVRPTNAVFWKSDYCVCKDGKPISYGNCSSFCSTKNTGGAEILYASFNLGDSIKLNKDFETLLNWCQRPLETDTTNPSCALQAKDEAGNITMINEVTVSGTANSITTNVQNALSYDKTYVLTLVEKTSGAKSDSIQMIKFSSDISLPVLGPLKNVPVTQYTCLVRGWSYMDDIPYYDNVYRQHYYFAPRLAPDIMPPNTAFACHDYLNPAYGNIDRENYPRLETLPAVFNLWDETDPRFHDNNGNGAMDINDAIIQKTRNFGGSIAADAKFFHKFPWRNFPDYEDGAKNVVSGNKLLGYFMAPWIDQQTYKSYCLNNTHYNSTNPLFKALRDYIGVETEGLYLGVKSAEAVTDSNGDTVTGLNDYILIRESDLKAVWYYIKAGVPTAPTDDNVANNQIFFHYPLNKASPFVRTSTQRTFRVKTFKEINDSSTTTPDSPSTSTSGTTSYQPHDRKIGCIPKF